MISFNSGPVLVIAIYPNIRCSEESKVQSNANSAENSRPKASDNIKQQKHSCQIGGSFIIYTIQ